MIGRHGPAFGVARTDHRPRHRRRGRRRYNPESLPCSARFSWAMFANIFGNGIFKRIG